MTSTPHSRSAAIAGVSLLVGVGLVSAAFSPSIAGAAPKGRISLTEIGTYETGQFDESAAEIVAHDPETQQLFVVNAQKGAIDVLDISAPSAPTLVATLIADGPVNSVAVRDGYIAVAVEADPNQDPGWVQFFAVEDVEDVDAEAVATVQVGALPDMVTFTPDGTKVVVANEGEPDGYCLDEEGNAGDPEGSISIIDVSGGIDKVTQDHVSPVGFTAFDDQIDELRAAGVRIFGPEATVAQDLEPEYVVVDADSTTAWVGLQENNALAIVDLATATVTDIVPLGFKDHSLAGNALDPSNRDGGIAIANWPVRGMYMPDGMDAYEFGRRTYIVTANEGDARDYDCYSEEIRIGSLDLDETAFPNADDLQENVNLGRLNSTTSFDTTGFERVLNDDGQLGFVPLRDPATQLYSYGARSFSIWDESGGLVFDSGDDFEQITARLIPTEFNSNNDENGSFDSRSDDKGPEPEGIEIAQVFSKTYAFIGLERVGGIMVYDITTPRNPKFVEYVTGRDFTGDAEAGTAGDLGPEGLTFIAPADSPNGRPLLVVANEVSGSTTIFQIDGPGRSR
ncbi:MAG TPA: choice-of-anchor I family protein [Ilumatobacteraceae bacterium]|nr:choice-of-anchor I family protein [Ilumatobacteraceae bacterium]